MLKNTRNWEKITSLNIRVMPLRIALVWGRIFELLESVLSHFLDSFGARSSPLEEGPGLFLIRGMAGGNGKCNTVQYRDPYSQTTGADESCPQDDPLRLQITTTAADTEVELPIYL